MELKRHNLVEISPAGREKCAVLYFRHKASSMAYNFVRKIIVDGFASAQVPGIIRREEERAVPGTIPVGFSSPFLG